MKLVVCFLSVQALSWGSGQVLDWLRQRHQHHHNDVTLLCQNLCVQVPVAFCIRELNLCIKGCDFEHDLYLTAKFELYLDTVRYVTSHGIAT